MHTASCREGLVVDAARRTESLSSRRLILSFFRNSTGCQRPSLCGEGTLPTTYAPDPQQALDAVSGPPSGLFGLASCRAAPPLHAAAYRRHCRRFRPPDRDGRIGIQEENAPNRLFWSMTWLDSIRSHHRDETWSASLWHTFFALVVGAQVRVPPLARRT